MCIDRKFGTYFVLYTMHTGMHELKKGITLLILQLLFLLTFVFHFMDPFSVAKVTAKNQAKSEVCGNIL